MKQSRLIFIIISIIIISISCSKAPLEFENPNDPNSKIYIESEIRSGWVDRTDYSIGDVNWIVFNPDEDIEEFNIYRYIYLSTDSNSKSLDIKFTIPIDEIEYTEDDSTFIWSDTSLIFNTKYQYRIAPVASGIESNNDIEFDYVHGFIFPNNVGIDQTSDTSISIIISNIDVLADSIRIIWQSSDLTKMMVFDDKNIDFIFQWTDGNNDIDNNQITIDYSYFYDDTIQWINVYTKPAFIFQFPEVENFSGVLFNDSIIRLIWQYPYPSDDVKIQATSFLIKRGGILIDSIFSTQQILDDSFYVYYDEIQNSSNYEYDIIPATKYHQGDIIGDNFSSFVDLKDSYNNYTFVDTAFGSKGVYINKYEVTNQEFCNWAKGKIGDEDFSIIDSTMTDFDSSFNINTGRENFPVRGIPYLVAEKYTKYMDAEIPSDRVWMLAASASLSSDSYRDYPWGNDSPDNKANYQMNHYGPISVENLPEGRVKINQDYNILGPYNMAGNVMEWVADTSSCFGVLKKTSSTTWYNCKGGNWRDGSEYLLIWENYCQPADYSDEVIGFRLMKR